MSEYYRPIGAYPLRYFYEIINVSSAFRDALAVKISIYLLKGSRTYGGFTLRVSGFPKLSAPNIVWVSNPDMGVNLDPTDKVFFFADSGSPGGPN